MASFSFLKQKSFLTGLRAPDNASAIYTFYSARVAHLASQKHKVNPVTTTKIEDAWVKLNKGSGSEKCKSPLKKQLTKKVLDQCKHKESQLGASLYDAIRSGVFSPDASAGVYVLDADLYKTFASLIELIIQDYLDFGPKDKQPPVNLSEDKTGNFPPLDSKGKYIKSTSCVRLLAGSHFNPCLTEDNYLIMKQKEKNSFAAFTDKELKGPTIRSLTKKTQNKLHFLFKKGDRHIQHANGCNYWLKVPCLTSENASGSKHLPQQRDILDLGEREESDAHHLDGQLHHFAQIR